KGRSTPFTRFSHGVMQKIKGAKVSIADPRPFATPSRSLSRQNYRALLCNDCDSLREKCVAPGTTFSGSVSHSFFRSTVCTLEFFNIIHLEIQA
ncbi:MAG TPA: hypothetical protein PKM07_03440, partial [Spirochaetota bacterium]|nr:hypothetical protein [Spirochaetota bacterium]